MTMEVLSNLVGRPFDLGVTVVSLSVLACAFAYRSRKSSNESAYPLPPGPPTDFLIGSLRHFPSKKLWPTFCQWQKSYGDIVYAKLPGTSFIMLNSYELSEEILSKRTNITSDRSAGFMVMELMNLKWFLTFLQPGAQHANQRRMLRKGIGPARIGSHDSHVEKIASDFVLELSNFQGYVPKKPLDIMGRVIIELAYGEEIFKKAGKELLADNGEIIHNAELGLFNAWLVDFLPFLRHIPSWMPGAMFKRLADRTTELSHFVRTGPFEKAKALHSAGTIGHSIAADLLDEFGADTDVQDALAILFAAGSDTTSGAVGAFIHHLFLFPEVADKVYNEIQQVTHGQRLVEIADRPLLPYTEAVWKESTRWNPFFTLGVPHVNREELVVNGYRIPAGSLIGQNIGFMLNDPKIWGDPEEFRPERYLDKGAESLPNPMDIVFGYGARVCPGRYLADRAGFHLSAVTASLFHVLPLEGKARPDPKTVEYQDMPLRFPVNFHARFVPRDENAENILKSIALNQ